MSRCIADQYGCGCTHCRADIIPPARPTRALTVTIYVSLAITVLLGLYGFERALERVNNAHQMEQV